MSKVILIITYVIISITIIPIYGQDGDKDQRRLNIINKASELGLNLTQICNKDISYDKRLSIVNETMKLFVDPDNQKVEVSSIKPGSTITTYTVRQYLNHILDYKNYKEVKLNCEYTSLIEDLHKDESGDYVGTLRILQTFKGKGITPEKDYEDRTIKDIKIIGDKDLDMSSIKFGSIKVIKTAIPSKSASKT